MDPIFYVIFFVLGVSGTLIFVKTGKTVKHKREVNQLEIDKADLAQIITQNQRDINDIKTDVAELSGQVIQCLEILASVTRIRERIEDIDTQVIITKRFKSKYERSLLNNSEGSND